jgi:hypothetical protein
MRDATDPSRDGSEDYGQGVELPRPTENLPLALTSFVGREREMAGGAGGPLPQGGAPSAHPDQGEVFTTNPDGNDEVYSMFATGTSQSNVSRAPSADSGPSWQPLPTTYTGNSIQDSADFNVGDGRCFAR